jgi:hypothetical protein
LVAGWMLGEFHGQRRGVGAASPGVWRRPGLGRGEQVSGARGLGGEVVELLRFSPRD